MAELSIEQLIAKRRQRYESVKNIYCPFLKDVIYFNNQGFHHATHDGRNKIRSNSDARMRLNLLPHIYYVIRNSRKFNRQPQVVPKSAVENKFTKEVIFYELYCAMGRNKDKKKIGIIVVLRKIGNGRLHYYSVRYATNKQNRP